MTCSNRFPPLHMKNAKTMEILKLFSFRLSEFDKPAFSKNSTLGTVIENLRFCSSNSPSMYGRKAKSERKKLRFQNISMDGTLICLKNTLTYTFG